MESHHRRYRLLEEVAGVKQGTVASKADYEVYFVGEIVFSIAKCHKFVFDRREWGILLEKRILHYCCLYEYYHPFLLRAEEVNGVKMSHKPIAAKEKIKHAKKSKILTSRKPMISVGNF